MQRDNRSRESRSCLCCSSNKIDEDRKANLIKSIFKPWPPVRFRKCPPFETLVLSQRIHIHAGSLG
jgi:hypothetical protein